MTAPAPDVVKYYTRARKFPQLIGRTPDGAKIPGGPYTFTQAVAAGAVLLLGVNTMGLWARYGLIGNALLLLGAAYATVLALGRLPVGARNPLAVAAGAAHALVAPRTGRLAGRPVRLRRPHRVRHRVTALVPGPAPARSGVRPAAGIPAEEIGRSTGAVTVAPPARRHRRGAHWAEPTRPNRGLRRRGPHSAGMPVPAAPPSGDRRPAPTRPPALSGVQVLLAQSTAGPGT